MVWRRHSDSQTIKDTLHFWNGLGYSFAGTSSCRHNVGGRIPRTAQILVRCILKSLIGSVAMDGRHHGLFNAKTLFYHGYNWSYTIGSTAAVVDDIAGALKLILVDT